MLPQDDVDPMSLFQGELAAPSGRAKERGAGRRADRDEQVVDGRLSKQILSQARRQLQELEGEAEGGADAGTRKKTGAVRLASDRPAGENSDEEGDVSDDEEEEDDVGGVPADLDPRRMATELRISEKDESAFDAFRRPDAEPRQTLADVIMQKIEERKTEINTQFTDPESLRRAQLDPRVVEMYEGVGRVLERYRSGKVPKAFKVIPQFRNWEELALLTCPQKWSAAATFKATKIFVSGLNEKMAQRFFNLLLLPRIRDDIDTYQRLNFHLYQALMKALFKPGKQILSPVCREKNMLNLPPFSQALSSRVSCSLCASRATALSARPPL